MTQIQHGSAAFYDPEEYRKMFINSKGMFQTVNIKEVLPDEEPEGMIKGKYMIIRGIPDSSAEHQIAITIVENEEMYQSWLIDLYRYLHRHNVDNAMTPKELKLPKSLTANQRFWLRDVNEQCVHISKMPTWLEHELEGLYTSDDRLLNVLTYTRVKYDPERLYEEICGFRLQKYYKLENVERILQNFNERLELARLPSLEPLLVERAIEGMMVTKDRNGRFHNFAHLEPRLTHIIAEIREKIADEKFYLHRNESMRTNDVGKKVHKPYNKFSNKPNNNKNFTKKSNVKQSTPKVDDKNESKTVANLRH
ncbi:hypothetical protein KLMA_40421 [Kluyveromyces marxianus DMKU3-1042]|uniref:Uncharacterized protein n=1 Tax=Kluyveromyces marxianus (strain DMKU3-1042 / BCC 29191 / NBRC 104275) TaxID=1003335 RepID=W0TAL1_KLUMD|nr:hypothetical protein KLMA_10555 [Kluyveromyces marxianus DMKU3-1042]XP_022674270.1 hypothetical protein KLMA_10759 [Kluyveromyces marxianus DMKU3-1042]XP_022676266.1 hypothetical protein KLMA_40421 [Kluyveromyces marxianus DMKU3-1042]BAO38177.1 hypothetical protein KLMA_10555 [Kluyveromyces marxianus DMKU3-1042]BAO38381.1 hypothetical protein KLMA_10759 [Kluyveromyces marxianus DMKU3-1042]BAO40445.1 hypothetical protein KLMA_40421 [Kluyveromyces marxianus DMKU3-1042]